jgi:hypothetical protein
MSEGTATKTQRSFSVSLTGLIRNACSAMRKKDRAGWAFMLEELHGNLKEVKEAHDAGRSKEILDEFFDLYKFQ